MTNSHTELIQQKSQTLINSKISVMKKLIFFTLLSGFILQSEAQTLQFDWAIAEGADQPYDDFVQAIAPCPDGDIVVCGGYTGTIDFDYGAGVDDHSSFGNNDCFIQKIDPLGNAVWTVSLGGAVNDFATSIQADDNGDIYTTGIFNGTVDFDPGASVIDLTTATQTIFVQKLDADGNLIWAFNVEGSSQKSRLDVDKDGNILLTGWYDGTIDLDPGVGVVNFSTVFSSGFMAKYDPMGNLIWAKDFPSPSYIYMNGLESDENGNIYIGGFFSGNVDMDPSAASNFLNSTPSQDNSYVAKYSTNGDLIWAKNFLGSSNVLNAITLDQDANVYAIGDYHSFSGAVDFDPGAGNTNSMGISSDLFLVKLDMNGDFVWVNSVGGTGADIYKPVVSADAVGNIYFAGTFNDTLDFDSGVGVENTAGSAVTAYNLFLSKVNTDGDFEFVFTNPGDNYSTANAISINNDGSIYVAGNFNGTVDFDPSTGTFSQTGVGSSQDFYVQKYQCFVDISVTNSGGTFTSNQTGASYQWMDCSINLPLVGETNQSYTPAVNGTYCVIITNGECIGKSAEITINNVGLETNSESLLSIYPNPVSATLTVSSASTILTYEITDLSGKIISHQLVNASAFNIDMSLFSEGVYMLKTTGENGMIQCSKIIKQ